MDNNKNYMKVPLIKDEDGIQRIEDGKMKDIEFIYCNDLNNYYKTKKFYAYKVKEDTMNPMIIKNDIVIFEKTSSVSNHNICVVKIANEELIVRRILKDKGVIILESLNREYDATFYSEKDLDGVLKIIGKVVKLIRNI